MESTTRTAAKILNAGDGERLSVMGDEVRLLLSSDETDGSMTLVQQRSLPGSGIPLHINTLEDEVFQVLEGQVEFRVDDRTILGKPGTTLFLPRRVPHAFKVIGPEPAHLQITITPGGLEKMIQEIRALPAPPSPRSVAAICQKYGVSFIQNGHAASTHH